MQESLSTAAPQYNARVPRARQFREIVGIHLFTGGSLAKQHVLGPGGKFIHHIQDQSGARIWLREDPLQLEVSASSEKALGMAVSMARDLADTVSRRQWPDGPWPV